MSFKTDYITDMVNETFRNSEFNVLPFASPRDSNQMEMSFCSFSVKHDSARSCLVFDLKGKKLEIPTNYGPFQKISFDEPQVRFQLNADEDFDYILPAIAEIAGFPIRALKIKAKEGGLILELSALSLGSKAS